MICVITDYQGHIIDVRPTAHEAYDCLAGRIRRLQKAGLGYMAEKDPWFATRMTDDQLAAAVKAQVWQVVLDLPAEGEGKR